MPTTGRWGWYKDHEGNEFQRVSTLIKKVETDRFNLDLYIKRQVLIGAGRRDDLVLAVKSMRPDPVYGWTDRQKKEINELVEKAEEAAKDVDGATIGTAVHTLTERLDRGEDLESVVRGLPAQAEMDLRAYAALIALNGWKIVEIERTVVNDDLNVAGTFDRVYVVPGLAALLGPGTCQHPEHGGDHDPMGEELAVIGDVKTEKDPTKNGLHIGPQLAIYSRARRMWTPGAYVPAPCVRQDVAVVVHVRNGHAVPMFVNLTDGWDAALAARRQADREKAAKMWLAPMPNIKEPAPAAVATATAVHQDYANPNRTPVLTGLGAAPAISEAGPVAGALVTAGDMNPLSSVMVDTQIGIGVDRPHTPIEHIAVENNGMVSWERVSATTGLDDVDKSAIDTIWAAGTLADLSRVWDIYVNTVGRTWEGRVAEAATARARQIECPQRALHTNTARFHGRVKCACGWTKEVPA